MFEMHVKGIAVDVEIAQPMVILEDLEKTRTLPIMIGASDARAISFAFGDMNIERPLVHGLLLKTIVDLGYRVKHVELDRLGAHAYSANISLNRSQESVAEPDNTIKVISARPSDAIALALVAHAPIYASPDVMLLNTRMSAPEPEEEDELETAKFVQFVERLQASDFQIVGVGPSTPIDEDVDVIEVVEVSEDKPDTTAKP